MLLYLLSLVKKYLYLIMPNLISSHEGLTPSFSMLVIPNLFTVYLKLFFYSILVGGLVEFILFVRRGNLNADF